MRARNLFATFLLTLLGTSADSAAQEQRAPKQSVSAVSHKKGHEIARTWAVVEDLGRGDNSSDIFGVNTRTGRVLKIGETGVDFLADITFTPKGDLFAVTFSEAGDSFLVLLNRSTAKLIKWWEFPWKMRPNTLESDKKSRLWIAGRDGLLYRVNRSITTITRLGQISGDGTLSPSGDIVFRQDGRLYGSMLGDGTTDVLARIHKGGDAAVVIGKIGYPGVFGLAFGPDNNLYGVAHGNDPNPPIIRIKTKVNPIGPLGKIVARTDMPSAGGMTARRVLSPVKGKSTFTPGTFNQLTQEVDCVNDPKNIWTFCQHKTREHIPAGGECTADETYAWDINLANRSDLDEPVFAIAPGKVVRYDGRENGEPFTCGVTNRVGSVLVKHTAKSGTWYSGYLHMNNLTVEVGDRVGTETKLGTIGAKGLEEYEDCIGEPEETCAHLHFAVYLGENKPGKLVSVDATFFERR